MPNVAITGAICETAPWRDLFSSGLINAASINAAINAPPIIAKGIDTQ